MRHMLTRQQYVTRLSAALSALKGKFSTLNLKRNKQFTVLFFPSPLTENAVSKKMLNNTILFCTEILALTVVTLTNVHAEARLYRYYDSHGTPTISSTVSEQHLQQGYDVLDSRMQLIHHYQPFSTGKYAQQQILREQAINKKINERHLQETYISADRALTQRDRELSNIDEQIQRIEIESKHISADLNGNITAAADFDRQNKAIPAFLKTQLNKSRALLNQSNANITALKAKREQTSKQFNDAIAQLKILEASGNKPDITNTP
jgi:hypothetical protein